MSACYPARAKRRGDAPPRELTGASWLAARTSDRQQVAGAGVRRWVTEL